MSTATTTKPFVCTAPTVWPDPFLIGTVRSKAKPAGECWQEFATEAERDAHKLEAHAEFMADLSRGEAIRASRGGASRPVVSEAYTEPERPSGNGGGASTPTDNSATEKQLAFIASLAEQKGVEANEVKTSTEARAEIDRLKALRDVKSYKTNRFAGTCSDCGVRVEAGQGFVRQVDGRWLTGHIDGCPDTPDLPARVEDGFYAVTADAGHTSFYKVTNGRKPGVVFVDLLLGGGPNGGFQREKVPFGNINIVLSKIIEVGPAAAGLRFRQEARRCTRCGRGLSNKVSRDQALGPECAKA